MKVLIATDAGAAAGQAARIIARQLRARPDAVLGLATGATMRPVYDRLVRCHREAGLSFARATTFNLDEYLGLSPDHPGSCHRYMREALFDRVDLSPDRTHVPRGDHPDPLAEARNYEARIARAGGIDLQLLGIGRNGHIGFNEPISSLGSRSRVTTLTSDTRRANQRDFGGLDATPRQAITLGVATILEARACLMLATGPAKARAVAGMIEGPLRAACPASALQMHPQVTVVLDRDAASRLKLTGCYDRPEPEGRDRDPC